MAGILWLFPLSTNEGQSWEYTRHIEWHDPSDKITGAYPSIICGVNGNLHIVYSYVTRNPEGEKGESISYRKFDTDWIKQGDLPPFPAFRVGAAVRKLPRTLCFLFPVALVHPDLSPKKKVISLSGRW